MDGAEAALSTPRVTREFDEVVAEVVRFVDPLVEAEGDVGLWSPQSNRWMSPGGG